MSKLVTFGVEARNKLKEGVDLISNSVKVTLGPKGRNAFYSYHYGYPISTKDGVTVARQVDSSDEQAQMGLLLVRQVAQKTADDAGDGTTTACILTQAIYNEGLKCLSSGANPILIKRGIDKAVEKVLKYIDSVSITIDQKDMKLFDIATISANNDPFIGKIIVEAISKVSKNGVITIEDNFLTTETYVDTVEGMQLNEGMMSPFFCTDMTKMEAVYKNAQILLVDGDIEAVSQIEAITNKSLKNGKPFVIICNSMTPSVLQVLVATRAKSMVPILVCKAPQFGQFRTEQMLDMSCLIGGKLVGAATGIGFNDVDETDLGECDTITSTRHSTVIVGGKGSVDRVKERIKSIELEIEKAQSDYDKEKLQERLAKLTSGVAIVKIGAQTEVELKEIKMRVEDSLHAARAAIEDGIVSGGGVVYLQASKQLIETGDEEEVIGLRIIKKALLEPIKIMAFNAGLEGGEIISGILNPLTKVSIGGELVANPNYGYNFLTDQYGDMIQMGVIDPTKVVKLALKNSASAAGMLLTTEVCINEVFEDDDKPKLPKTPRPQSE